MADLQPSVVRLPDTDLHYVELGAGPPVLLVHGGFADYRLWWKLAGALSRDHRVVTYSRRGYFPNAWSEFEGPRVAGHSADLLLLASELFDGPFHLVGESLGASVSVRFAIDHPSQVRSLSIDEPPLPGLLPPGSRIRRELEGAISAAMKHYSDAQPTLAAEAIIDFLEGSAGVYASLPEGVKQMILANSRATLLDVGGMDAVEVGECEALKAPVLLLKSDGGHPALKLVVDELHRALPASSLKEIPGTSHGTIVDSEGYSDEVLDFIRSC